MFRIRTKVYSDKKAFENIEGRLTQEVGTIIELVRKSKKEGYFKNSAPFWSLVRMLFPVAESIGDLLNRSTSTSDNLKYALESLGTNYQDKAALISLMYRHSLMHQDELRVLRISATKVTWGLTFDGQKNHLNFARPYKGIYRITFDLTQFYEDLVKKLGELKKGYFKKRVQARYNEWQVLQIQSRTTKPTEKAAIAELEKLKKGV